MNEYSSVKSEMRGLFLHIRFPKSLNIYCPMCVHVFVFSWNKTTNPEPWNKLDPTYQYKVI